MWLLKNWMFNQHFCICKHLSFLWILADFKHKCCHAGKAYQRKAGTDKCFLQRWFWKLCVWFLLVFTPQFLICNIQRACASSLRILFHIPRCSSSIQGMVANWNNSGQGLGVKNWVLRRENKQYIIWSKQWQTILQQSNSLFINLQKRPVNLALCIYE